MFYEDLRPSDIVRLDRNGRTLSSGVASRESPMHVALYRFRPHLGAVVHTRSPWATAWSHLVRDLESPTEELQYHGLRQIPCSAPAAAGSVELARAAVDVLGQAPVALLARHGVVATGASLRAATELAAVAEQQAHLEWLIRRGAVSPHVEA